ncbi:MAG: HmuY family protein [bacterium]|nr:HmuY family protein [bacterium]
MWIESWRFMLYGMGVLLLVGCPGQSTDASAVASGPVASSSTTYKPTPPHPREVGDQLIGPYVYTVDARSKEIWMYFDFSRASVVAVQNLKIDDWDLAFRRHAIRSNGGATNAAGQAALLRLEGEDLKTVQEVPKGATFTSDVRAAKRLFPNNPVVEKWYNYSYISNILIPKPAVYLVRTQDGKYAKLRLLSYYCEGNISGCMTFEYVYQGSGSTNLARPKG